MKLVGELLQVPVSDVSVEPAVAVPEIVGNTVLAGVALLAACPIPGTPKIAPITSAETATITAVGQRRRGEILAVMWMPPLRDPNQIPTPDTPSVKRRPDRCKTRCGFTQARSRSAIRSATAMVLRFVFARGIVGMIEASAT